MKPQIRPDKGKMLISASLLTRSARAVVGLALPPRCSACGVVVAEDRHFCTDCWLNLGHIGDGCVCCGDPELPAYDQGQQCARCLSDPPPFDTMRAAVAYGDIARDIALRLKHGGRIGLARTVALAMRPHLAGFDDAVLVPVPLHPTRLWQRGFNQSVMIARELEEDSGPRMRTDWLVRTRKTPFLRGLSADRRGKAVRGAFAVPATARPSIRGRRIVLIDDVYTSGSTARACAKVLRRHGAAEIHVRCWARVSRIDTSAY